MVRSPPRTGDPRDNVADRLRPDSGHRSQREILKKKLTPDYNLGCTRIPKSDKNYYAAVQVANAHILKGQIARIAPEGVVMADGTRAAVDVLVYATGFDAHAHMRPMNVMGLNGTPINEAWKEKIGSYGGIALPGFPNLFMLYGPFSPATMCRCRWASTRRSPVSMRLVAEARARDAAVGPTVEATEKFLARRGAAFPGTVWVGGCKNWYTDRQGTPILWPLPQSEHKAFFDEIPVEDFQFTPTGPGNCSRPDVMLGSRDDPRQSMNRVDEFG